MARYTIVVEQYFDAEDKNMTYATLKETDSIDEAMCEITRLADKYEEPFEEQRITYIKELGYCWVNCYFTVNLKDSHKVYRIQNTLL